MTTYSANGAKNITVVAQGASGKGVYAADGSLRVTIVGSS